MSKKQGFTLIEVVLVMAIAGLIFLMVFIALPQMQRLQRDTARKDDMMTFVEAVKKYQSNYRGTLPKLTSDSPQSFGMMTKDTIGGLSTMKDDNWWGFWYKYIEDDFGDPRDDYYNLTVVECEASTNPDDGGKCANQDLNNFDTTIYVYTGGVCQEDHAIPFSNPRSFAVVYHTESSGNYCFDSNS